MKWSTLLSKVVFAAQQPPPPPPPPASPLHQQQGDQAYPDSATPRLSSASTSGSGAGDDGGIAASFDAASGNSPSAAASSARFCMASSAERERGREERSVGSCSCLLMQCWVILIPDNEDGPDKSYLSQFKFQYNLHQHRVPLPELY